MNRDAGVPIGAWRRVRHLMEAIPPLDGISAGEESRGGATFSNRSSEALDLGFENVVARGA